MFVCGLFEHREWKANLRKDVDAIIFNASAQDGFGLEGEVCVIGDDEFDVELESGMPVAEVVPASIRTQVCQACGRIDTDALIDDGSLEICECCRTPLVLGPERCSACGAGEENVAILSYAGCSSCRPERLLQGSVRYGAATGLLARAGMSYAKRDPEGHSRLSSSAVAPCVSSVTGAVIDRDPAMHHPVFHIVEEPGGIRRLSECEVPTEVYNEARLADLARRHPNL